MYSADHNLTYQSSNLKVEKRGACKEAQDYREARCKVLRNVVGVLDNQCYGDAAKRLHDYSAPDN